MGREGEREREREGDVKQHIFSLIVSIVPVRCEMCRQTFRTNGYLSMHMAAHRDRPNVVNAINQAPPRKTPEGKFICRLCGYMTARSSHYSRHVKRTHLRPVTDIAHRNSLRCYAQAKKAAGTSYYQAKNREEAVQREILEMGVVLDDGSVVVQVHEVAGPSNVNVGENSGANVNVLPIVGGDAQVIGYVNDVQLDQPVAAEPQAVRAENGEESYLGKDDFFIEKPF